ncbi:MAG: hypothetical protein A2X86_12820 [Bdellovibrionales bacterium GWA2_49_15]|nr:MAG: hypothetical protein A2X86_12820 [Bdellovibrionales bacterium GWA2_49_15]HAZ14736.1 hypothetical protein [Bdellovibrionales bacterium]
MIVPKLYGIHSPDIADLKLFVPNVPNKFSILIQVFVGPEDDEGFESFDFVVCTADWLKEKYKNEIVFLKNFILVPHYSYSALYQRIEKLVKSISGDDWAEYATRLSRWGQWEFEDYKE